MNRSIFWASPGRRKLCRNCRNASTNRRLANSIRSTNACMIAMFCGSPSPRYSPTMALSNRSLLRRNLAISSGESLLMKPSFRRAWIPRFGLKLNWRTASFKAVFLFLIFSISLGSSSATGVDVPWSTPPIPILGDPGAFPAVSRESLESSKDVLETEYLLPPFPSGAICDDQLSSELRISIKH